MRGGRSPRGGFTLVELLVVLLVLGIMAATTVARLERDERGALEREAIRLAGALELASATAQWRSETLGVSAEGTVYRFWRLDGEGQWRVIAADETLAARALPQGMDIRPDRYAGVPVDAAAIIPLRASGRNEPYRIQLAAGQWRAVIDADPLNRVSFMLAPRTAPLS